MFSVIGRVSNRVHSTHVAKRRSQTHKTNFSQHYNAILARGEHLESNSDINAPRNLLTFSKVEKIFINSFKQMKTDGFNPNNQFPITQKLPLHMAVTKSCLVSSALLEIGANINKYNRFGSTPLLLTVMNNNVNCAKLLLNRGANVKKINDPDNAGLLPIHRAGNVELIALLLEHGSPINSWAKTDFASNCLQYNVMCLNLEGVEFLLENGALDLPNSKGVTAYKVALDIRKIWSEQPFSEKSAEMIKQTNLILDSLKPLFPKR